MSMCPRDLVSYVCCFRFRALPRFVNTASVTGDLFSKLLFAGFVPYTKFSGLSCRFIVTRTLKNLYSTKHV
jgi:hypothetical protein